MKTQTWGFHFLGDLPGHYCHSPFPSPPACVTSVDGNPSCTAIDGRVVMHNPTAAAITHVLHNKREFPFVRGVEDLLVLSLGTGQIDQTYMYDTVRGWGTMQWVKSLAKIVLDGVADTVDHTISMAFGEHRKHYLRIQVTYPGPGRYSTRSRHVWSADLQIWTCSVLHRRYVLFRSLICVFSLLLFCFDQLFVISVTLLELSLASTYSYRWCCIAN